jgi:hypothetical protein
VASARFAGFRRGKEECRDALRLWAGYEQSARVVGGILKHSETVMLFDLELAGGQWKTDT